MTEDLPPSSTPAKPLLLPDGPPLAANLGGKSLGSGVVEGPRNLVVDLSLVLDRGGCACGLCAVGNWASLRGVDAAGALKPGSGVVLQRECGSPGSHVVCIQRRVVPN